VKIVSYFRVASHTTLNMILYEPRQENISGWKEESAGEFPKLGSAVQVCADYVRGAKQRGGNIADRAELRQGASVRLGPLLQRRKCQRPGPYILG
jgi:hypothetical protein